MLSVPTFVKKSLPSAGSSASPAGIELITPVRARLPAPLPSRLA